MATAEKRVALGSGLALERYRREVTPTKRIRHADGAGEKAVGRGPAPWPPPTLRGSADVDLAHTGAADQCRRRSWRVHLVLPLAVHPDAAVPSARDP
jgi:hypothetical protein